VPCVDLLVKRRHHLFVETNLFDVAGGDEPVGARDGDVTHPNPGPIGKDCPAVDDCPDSDADVIPQDRALKGDRPVAM
jgi:hypothetical protein